MHRTIGLVAAILASLVMSEAASAMGYDSLACPELGERRVAYFVENGFCDPGRRTRKTARRSRRARKPSSPNPRGRRFR